VFFFSSSSLSSLWSPSRRTCCFGLVTWSTQVPSSACVAFLCEWF
jgi:hypothetical protein